jgi:hypothetical protein
MIITLLVLAALTLSSLMAMNVAVSDGAIMRNNRTYRCDLYRAETGITVAGEHHAASWLAPDSDLFDLSLDEAAVMVDDFTIAGVDGHDMPVMGKYAVARIESAPAAGSLSERFYALGHQAPMPIGSGFSARSFEIRRYGVLSTGSSNPDRPGVTVEAGVYKVFNAF